MRWNYVSKNYIIFNQKKLGLKKNEKFKFVNQKQKGVYWFTGNALIKSINKQEMLSHASLNWMLDNDCKIIKV